jgi:hypothetical protein
MKHRMILLIFAIFFSTSLDSQTIMDVARSKSITWYGMDFSKAKFIGFGAQITADMIKDDFITRWINNISTTDFSSKYNIPEVKIEMSPSLKHNSGIDKNTLLTNNYYELSTETIQKIITDYDISGNGYGFVYIVESFEKSTEKVYIYVCYFNEKDKSIISMRRYIGKASGIGFQNHFEAAIKDIIKASCKDFKRFSKH